MRFKDLAHLTGTLWFVFGTFKEQIVTILPAWLWATLLIFLSLAFGYFMGRIREIDVKKSSSKRR